MRKYLSVLLGCFLVAMAVMPGAYSLWQKDIEVGGMVQIRQHHRVIEETTEKVKADGENANEARKETVNEGQKEKEPDDAGWGENEQNDDVQNNVELNSDKHDVEAPGE